MSHFLSTKTTSSHQTSSNKNLYRITLLFVILMVVFWWFPTIPAYLADKVFFTLFKSDNYLRKELSGISPQLNKNEATELDFLREENEELRSLLSDHIDPGIAAGVIARPSSLPYDALVIDRGREDEIKKGAPVYASSGQAIGVVASVYTNSSIVALISTPGWKSTAYVYGSNIYTTVEGQGGGVARVHVPQGIDLEEGNVVAVPALGGGVFGKVSFVDSVPSRPEQYGYVTMDTPISSLRHVMVGNRSLSSISFNEAKSVVENTRRDFLKVPVPEGVLVDIQNSTSTATSTSQEVSTSTPQ